MRIAFYAPMKSPKHPVPSGDRELARLIMRALKAGGHDVTLVSQFRSYDRNGSTQNQRSIVARSDGARCRTLRRLQSKPPEIWFTYHLYHKAPDFLGASISKHFGIPYIVADASHAPKQASGKWVAGFQSAQAAILAADRLICFDPLDAACLRNDLARADRLAQMAPFTACRPMTAAQHANARTELAQKLGLAPDMPWLITVAMMRKDIKSQSYQLLAEALHRLKHKEWALLVAGDGANRKAVEKHFQAFRNVRFLGELCGKQLSQLYAAGDIFAWPALNEGCSIALLEAQATGLPVLAGSRDGLKQFVKDEETGLLCPEGDIAAFSNRLEYLMDNPDLCRRFGIEAAKRATKKHSLSAAAKALNGILQPLSQDYAA